MLNCRVAGPALAILLGAVQPFLGSRAGEALSIASLRSMRPCTVRTHTDTIKRIHTHTHVSVHYTLCFHISVRAQPHHMLNSLDCKQQEHDEAGRTSMPSKTRVVSSVRASSLLMNLSCSSTSVISFKFNELYISLALFSAVTRTPTPEFQGQGKRCHLSKSKGVLPALNIVLNEEVI